MYHGWFRPEVRPRRLPQISQNILRFPNAAHPWEDVLDCIIMFLSGSGRRDCILHKDLLISVFVSKSCGALNPDTRRNAAQDYCVDSPPPKLKIEFSPIERSPLTLGDDEIVRFRT